MKILSWLKNEQLLKRLGLSLLLVLSLNLPLLITSFFDPQAWVWVGVLLLEIVLATVIAKQILKLALKLYVMDDSKDMSLPNLGNLQINGEKSEVLKLKNFVDKTAFYLLNNSLDQLKISKEIEVSHERTAKMLSEVEVSVGNASSSSESAKEKADQGNVYMGQLSESIESISNIKNLIQKFVGALHELKTRMGAIDEIVFKSKILSFNASIEAARAGEMGRTFSVVATEMTGLAERIGEMSDDILEILGDTEENVKELQGHVTVKVEESVEIIENSQMSFKDVIEDVYNLSEQVKNISEQVSTYNSTSQEVNDTLQKITQVSNTLGTAAANSKLLAVNLEEMLEERKESDDNAA